MSFSHEDKNLFVVGAENGSVFKCSMQCMESGSIDQITGTYMCGKRGVGREQRGRGWRESGGGGERGKERAHTANFT